MYRAQRSTNEKIVDTDDESFVQPTNLRELLTHRDDVIYAPRQSTTKTFNMRTWALSSRGVRSSANASVAPGAFGGAAVADGMSQVSGTTSHVPSPSGKPATSTKRAKQQQWLVDEEGAVEVDKPFFDYTFEHSSILEHRVDCPVRSTGPFALASIRSRKPGSEQNMIGASYLEERAEARVDESMQRDTSLFPQLTSPEPLLLIQDTAPNSTATTIAANPTSLVLGRGPLLGASFKHPLERGSSNLPQAFGAAHQEQLSLTASRVERHKEKLRFEHELAAANSAVIGTGGDDLVATLSSRYQNIPLHYQQCASRPESPPGLKPPRSPMITSTDFLFMAPIPAPSSLPNSRPSSQMTIGGRGAQPLPLPEFYRLSSPESGQQHRRQSNVTIEPSSVPSGEPLSTVAMSQQPSRDGSPFRVQVGGASGLNGSAALSVSLTSSQRNDTSTLSTFSERTRRILQSKAGSRLRRYYGESMHIMRKMDHATSAANPHNLLENLMQSYDEGADSAFPNQSQFGASQQNLLAHAHYSRSTAGAGRAKSGSLVDVASISAATGGGYTGATMALSGAYEDLSPSATRRQGGGDYDWRCYQSTAKFLRLEVQRKALPSACDAQLPLYYPIAYSELYEEQRILVEQRDLHNIAYEDTKALYRQQGAFIEVAMEAMAKGDFQKSYHVESSALKDIPELELTRMRLQRDTVPVMSVRHEGTATVAPAGPK